MRSVCMQIQNVGSSSKSPFSTGIKTQCERTYSWRQILCRYPDLQIYIVKTTEGRNNTADFGIYRPHLV